MAGINVFQIFSQLAGIWVCFNLSSQKPRDWDFLGCFEEFFGFFGGFFWDFWAVLGTFFGIFWAAPGASLLDYVVILELHTGQTTD